VAAIDEQGNVRVEAIASRRNLLTDQVVTTASGATIAAASFPGSLGRFVRVSELGDQLFVIAADGLARRYEIRSIESPTLMESFAAAPQGNGVVAVARLFGGNALAIADTAGIVQVWFATRAADAEAADGLQMVAAKIFPATKDQAAITAIAPSPRSRLFAVADASGGIRMLQSTNASTVLSLQSTVAGGLATPAGQLLIAPRENRLLAADTASMCAWSLMQGIQRCRSGRFLAACGTKIIRSLCTRGRPRGTNHLSQNLGSCLSSSARSKPRSTPCFLPRPLRFWQQSTRVSSCILAGVQVSSLRLR